MNNLSSPENMQGWYQKPLNEMENTEKNKQPKRKEKKVTNVDVITKGYYSDHIDDCNKLIQKIESSYDNKAVKELYDAIIHIEAAKKCIMFIDNIPFSNN